MNVYGVDIGVRRLAIADADSGHIDRVVLRRGDATIDVELRTLGWWIQQTVPIGAIVLVEMPVTQRGPRMNIQTAMRMAMVVGTVMTAHTGPAYPVNNAEWKVATVGDARADKPTIARWLEAHHPALAAACGGDQDLVDAVCISLAAPSLVPA